MEKLNTQISKDPIRRQRQHELLIALIHQQDDLELMDVEGVRAVNYVTISQDDDYNAGGAGQTFPGNQNLYTYQYDTENNTEL